MKCTKCKRDYERLICEFCSRERRWAPEKIKVLESLSPRLQRDLKSISISFDSNELNRVRNGGGLFLYGMTGSGKTLYAAAMYVESLHRTFVERVKPFKHVFVTIPNWLQAVRESYAKDEPNKNIEIQDVGFLVLDDLGVQKETDWSVEQLYKLINYRYENLLPTVFTSNLNGEQMAKQLGDRIPSRIIQMCVMKKMEAIDYRLKNKT